MFDGGSCMSHPMAQIVVSTHQSHGLKSAASDVFHLAAQQHQQHDQNDT